MTRHASHDGGPREEFSAISQQQLTRALNRSVESLQEDKVLVQQLNAARETAACARSPLIDWQWRYLALVVPCLAVLIAGLWLFQQMGRDTGLPPELLEEDIEWVMEMEADELDPEFYRWAMEQSPAQSS